MRVSILIRSYWKDAEWLTFCLRSIQKYAQGFAYTILVTPTRSHGIFEPLRKRFGVRLHEYVVRLDKPMLHSEVKICRADELCPDVDFILFMDSDCVFTQPVTPLDYFVKGKPVLLAESFDNSLRKPDSME